MLAVLPFLVAGARAAHQPFPGSPQYLPTEKHPVGWRGDGSGRYPGANPPTKWERKTGEKDGNSNIAWMTPLPNIGVSSPIIVGDRVLLTCEPADLVCIDKKDGHILWIRSVPEFEAMPTSAIGADPAYAEKLTPLAVELAKANEQAVAELNREMAIAPNSTSGHPPAALKLKRDIEKQIAQQQIKIDKKRFTHNWAQAVFGYTGATPTSDGKRVYAFLTTGVSVCHDLEGNRQWIASGEGMGSEHGNFASPILCNNAFIVWANELGRV